MRATPAGRVCLNSSSAVNDGGFMSALANPRASG